jgi:hypothetical protein
MSLKVKLDVVNPAKVLRAPKVEQDTSMSLRKLLLSPLTSRRDALEPTGPIDSVRRLKLIA